MRLWSLHPRYLDRQGLLACWREALLAQKVLQGRTIGYTHHPQLTRFRQTSDPLAAIAAFLDAVALEAEQRGYHFDRSKIPQFQHPTAIPVTRGQVLYEWRHLMQKLETRDPSRWLRLSALKNPGVNPVFKVIPGEIEPWERP